MMRFAVKAFTEGWFLALAVTVAVLLALGLVISAILGGRP
jgi:hypothetical protein